MKELEETAKFFHGKEVDGKKMVGITLRGKGAAATSQWVDFLYSFGGSWTNAQGQSNLAAAGSVAAFKFYGDLLKNYETYKSKDGAYVRQHFFHAPELRDLVADLSDEDIWRLNRGGHDPFKVYAAFQAAVAQRGEPTVILAKTIKGYGLGESGEAQNLAHQQKKVSIEALRSFRDRFQLPIPDEKLEELPYLKFEEGSKELEYLKSRRRELGGDRPRRRRRSTVSLEAPPLAAFERFLKSTEDREISTTMAFVQMLHALVRDKGIGRRIVPIVADEARTFGMEGMFRQVGIYSQVGQLYVPQDADHLAFYKEDKQGQTLATGVRVLPSRRYGVIKCADRL